MLFGKKEETIKEVGAVVSNEEEEMNATPDEKLKPYKFRKLKAKDIMPACILIRKLDLKELAETFTAIRSKAKEEGNLIQEEGEEAKAVQSSFGINIAVEVTNILLEKLPTMEQDIFGFLSGVSNLSAEQIADLDIEVFFEMVKDFVQKEEFVGFTKAVSAYLSK